MIKPAVKMRKELKRLGGNRGESIIPGIIFAAILILAVIAIDPAIRGVFTNLAADFGVWVDEKITALFN